MFENIKLISKRDKMIYMKQVYLIILSLSIFGCGNRHVKPLTQQVTIRPFIQAIADSMAADNMLKSEGVGYSGARTAQWERYEILRDSATTGELKVLTDNENAVVRCYAFQALANRKDADIFPILLKHLKDTTYVKTFFGCIVGGSYAGDYFLDIVTPEYIDLEAYKLSARERTIVDSILIFDPSVRIAAREQVLSNLKPISVYYDRIREIARTEQSEIATLALAKYKKQQDIPLIKALFEKEPTEYYAAYAAREFPDQSFYPFLITMFRKEWAEELYDYPKWRILYQALAQYPTSQTYELFEKTAICKDKFRYQTLGKYLLIAVTKYPNERFEPFKKKIKLDQYHQMEIENEMNIEN